MPEFNNLDRRVLYWCLVGSHNYNLSGADSDRDYKVFVLPTFEDLYYGKHYSAARISTNIDYDVHDIRKLALLLWKANINFIEVLFSEESRILAFNERMERILGERERLARMNLPYLWDACQGMYFNKFRQLERGTEGTQHLVERYGYSTKEALHCYRCLDFLERYHANGFTNFKQAIWYEDGPERDRLLQIKQGAYTLHEFKELVQAKRSSIARLEDAYKLYKPDYTARQWLDEQVREVIRSSLKDDS